MAAIAHNKIANVLAERDPARALQHAAWEEPGTPWAKSRMRLFLG